MQHAFYIAGGAFELLGILLLVAPDLVPGARRFARWLPTQWLRLERRLRRILRLKGRSVVIDVGATGAVGKSSTGARIQIDVDPAADVEQRVEFAIQRLRKHQEHLANLDEAIQALRRDVGRDVAALRESSAAALAAEFERSTAEYRALRIIGTICLVAGLGLSTAANFIG
jgi:hypothetical protein